MKSQIHNDGSFCTDLSQIKAIQKDYDSLTIIFNYKSRAEFRINPETGEEEMLEISESSVRTTLYSDRDQLAAYYEEWLEVWNDWLKENS